MDTQYAAINIETLTDKDVAKGVRFDTPQSQYSSDGMVKPITGKKQVNDTTTKNILHQNYLLGKSMHAFSEAGFEGLKQEDRPTGDTAWVMDTKKDDEKNFHITKAGIMKSVTLTEVKSEQEIKEKAKKYKIEREQTYITIHGKKYFVRTDMPMHFGTGGNSDIWINMGVFVVGNGVVATAIAGVIAKLGFDAFKDALKHIGTAVFKTLWAVIKGAMKASIRFITKFIGTLFNGENIEAAIVAGRAAAGLAWVEAIEGITAATLTYTLVGVIIIASLMIFIKFVLHKSYQNVYFYNLTGYDIQIDFPYKDYGDYHNLPTQNVEARISRKGPAGVILGEWYDGVAFRYQSNSMFHGLGYTMRFKLLDPKTQVVVKTFSCLFDVPFAADNSLYASIDEPSSYKDYYSKYSGEHKNTQYSAQDKEQEIIVTYNYLDGKHIDPDDPDGKKRYLYGTLVVIRDVVA